MPNALYVHIPFCKHICHYCDFNKVFLEKQPVDQYIEALGKEMALRRQNEPLAKEVETVYIGGGTPTALSTKQLDKVLALVGSYFIGTSFPSEWTVEVNPGEVEEEKLRAIKERGVNRLSIGVQSFSPHLLNMIGRTHTETEIYETIELARKVGFTNISIDLMFGLPEQRIADFEQTLDNAMKLDVEHISAYSLKVEEKTVFHNLQRKGKLSLPPEEEEVAMFELLIDRMIESGYTQYEISNFAKNGKESKHNLTYWDNNEYYGIGAGAHGYVNGKRYANVGPIPHYMSHLHDNVLPLSNVHEVTRTERIEEEMFMGLRKLAGISKKNFRERFGQEISDIYNHEITTLIENGLLEEEEDTIKLTKKGLFLANEVFVQFLG